MNSKNQLQEFCQKNGKKLPQYSTLQSNTCPPSFVSSVKLWDDKVFTGDSLSSKKKSEFDAAFKAYESLIKLSKRFIITSENSTVLLGNPIKTNCLELIKNYNFSSNITPLFFIDKVHPYASQKDNRFMVIDSNISDAMDIAIIITVTNLLLRSYAIYNKIIILSDSNIIKAFSDLYIQKMIANSNSSELIWITKTKDLFELKDISVDEQ